MCLLYKELEEGGVNKAQFDLMPMSGFAVASHRANNVLRWL
jgi:hypothetical protein